MKKATLAIAMLTLLSFGAAQAQTHFSLRLGGAFPMGKFADASANYSTGNLNWGLFDNSKKGGAGIGVTLGGNFKYDIASVKGLGVVASLDLMYNTLNSDIEDYFEEQVDATESNTREYSVTTPKYINIPVMVGLGYTYEATPALGLFAEVAIGANIRMITKAEENDYFTTTQYEKITTREYNTAATFAWRIGGGLMLNSKYTIGVDYYSLGMAKAEGTTYTEINGVEGTNPPNFKAGKITPTILTLRLGINF